MTPETLEVLAVTAHADRPEQEMFRLLRDRGVAFTVCCRPGTPTSRHLERLGIETIPLEMRSRFDPRAIGVLRRALKRRPRILHTFNNRALANGLLATRGTDVKIVAYRGTVGNVSRWGIAGRLTYLHPRVSKILCVSDAVRRFLASLGIPEDRLRTVYKGHDPSWYPPGSRNLLDEFRFPPGAFVVGCTANMRPLKGVSFLIEALRYLPEDHPVHLLLVGEVRDPRVARFARDPALARFLRFAGHRENPSQLMGACDLFVLPSLRREGFAKAVLEAMIQGTPAVVTDVGGLPEIVEAGVSGLVVPPGDPVELARAISRFAVDGAFREAAGRAARRRIVERFPIDATADAVLEVYRELVRSPSGSASRGAPR